MIKATILKNGAVTNEAKFNLQLDAEAWVQKESLNGSFGKIDRWLREGDFSGETISDAIDTREVISGISTIVEYKFPKEFNVEYVDITSELLVQKALVNRQKKKNFGSIMINKIAAMNDLKSLNNEQIDSFMTDPLILNLKSHLEVGNIDTFIYKLNISDVSMFFTSEEKASVILDCQNFLNSLN